MSRAFSTARQSLAKWLGYNKELLPSDFRNAAERYSENGAVKKVGKIESIEILHRNDGSSPVHQSHFNRNDKALVISARITPADGSRPRTHHIYADGTGTIKKGDKREYSTSSGHRA
ncbi:uncharacterized protein BO95DRAFT_430531 [Aspergillus brunneoviolaceus CBS 621.78]|uniref:Uncharacterized protein n=1 Tax=Aspergillus brunneoviolaceus CBS 621.78 TaxID=1450534 RepID=A0ACD1GD99_9EURO|nr:hypothetical protein BO95DRAFT_430531 [Aspergillus brunneoviolaceus CBS 621.78]RAH47243.1 hypothetical protein BO95DRAFT_430531 [Aspergillus brunneoviolaceus CBS 621.78]